LPCRSGIEQEEGSFDHQIVLKFKEETSKVPYLEHGTVWCCNLNSSEGRSEILGKFRSAILGKDVDQSDRSCENDVLQKSQREKYPTNSKKKEG
jgi:hypothetical protein